MVVLEVVGWVSAVVGLVWCSEATRDYVWRRVEEKARKLDEGRRRAAVVLLRLALTCCWSEVLKWGCDGRERTGGRSSSAPACLRYVPCQGIAAKPFWAADHCGVDDSSPQAVAVPAAPDINKQKRK